jgi:hypothetical protein
MVHRTVTALVMSASLNELVTDRGSAFSSPMLSQMMPHSRNECRSYKIEGQWAVFPFIDGIYT